METAFTQSAKYTENVSISVHREHPSTLWDAHVQPGRLTYGGMLLLRSGP